MKDEKSSKKINEGNVWIGILAAFIIYLLCFIIGVSVPLLPSFIFLGPILHIAAIIFAFLKGYKMTGIGLLIAGGIGILLVAACFGMLLNGNI